MPITQNYNNPTPASAFASEAVGLGLGDIDNVDLFSHIAHDDSGLIDVSGVPTRQSGLFVDLLMDLHSISSTIDSVEDQVRARRQQRRSGRALSMNAACGDDDATAAGRPTRSRRASMHDEGVSGAIRTPRSRARDSKGVKMNSKSGGAAVRRKRDDDALDCIYAELQESVGMCRYWGKKCWNLRVPKPKGGFHSLCHFHRAKANDNQRRFDYKRRGTLWRSFTPDPNSTDTSLFPAVPGDSSSDCGGALGAEGQSRPETAAKFEPFACPVALQDQDVELLQELVGSATISES